MRTDIGSNKKKMFLALGASPRIAGNYWPLDADDTLIENVAITVPTDKRLDFLTANPLTGEMGNISVYDGLLNYEGTDPLLAKDTLVAFKPTGVFITSNGVLNIVTSNFGWNPVNRKLFAGSALTVGGSGNDTVTFGTLNINNGAFGAFMVGEEGKIATGINAFYCGERGYAGAYGAVVMGRTTKVLGAYSFVGGWYSPGTSTLAETFLKGPRVAGQGSFGFYETDASQTNDHGVNASSAAILGGVNGNIPADSPRSVILGGNAIKARAAAPDQVYVPNLNIVTIPAVDNTLAKVLAINETTGQVKSVTKTTIAAKVRVTSNITGAASIDLATGDVFELTLTGNVSSFTFTNETLNKEYIFVFKKDTTEKTLAWAVGKYRFPFGNAPVLTNPTTNGTAGPARSVDIITALCNVAGRLDIVYTPDLIEN